jgi:hypothetical protein
MDFTEQEASDKVGQYVLLIKDHQDFLDEGVPKGTPGIVISCSYVGGTGSGVPMRYWAVNIRFYPPGQPNGVLIHHMGKDHYERVLAEADMASESQRR